eukprot:229432_1
MITHFRVIILLLFLGIVQSDEPSGTQVGGLSKLSFGGDGTREKAFGTGNYRYQWSSGFRGQICNYGEDNNCWNPQGISKWDKYITRSFYPKVDKGSEDNHYMMLSVIKRPSTPKWHVFKQTMHYSNILVNVNVGNHSHCHAGDNAIAKIDNVYHIVIACTTWVAIFSEKDIIKLDQPITAAGKDFYYYVHQDSIIARNAPENVYFAYISRNNGKTNEYYCGDFSLPVVKNVPLNLKKIKINPSNNWEITIITSYKTWNDAQKWSVQGATRVGDHMYLVKAAEVTVCQINKDNYLWGCVRKCNFGLDKICGALHNTGHIFGNIGSAIGNIVKFDFEGVKSELTDIVSDYDIWLQGAETDSNGDLYVGSEFGGGGCGHPFWEINNVKNDFGNCYSLGDADPYNNIQQPISNKPSNPSIQIIWKLNTTQLILFLLLLCAVCISTPMIYCSWTRQAKHQYSFVKTVSDTDAV